jgi:hypothetical protein
MAAEAAHAEAKLREAEEAEARAAQEGLVGAEG